MNTTSEKEMRSYEDILRQIEFYKFEEKRYEGLAKKFPNDDDYKRERYGYASRVFALEWVILFRRDSDSLTKK